MKREVYALYYYNGEQHDDGYSGLDIDAGIFTTIELAEIKKRELEIASANRIKEEIESGIISPFGEKETWSVIPIELFGNI